MYSGKRRSTESTRRAGFSLVEALGATAVVAIGLMGFSAHSVAMTHAEKHSDATAAALGLAQERLELLRSLPLGAVALTTGSYQEPTTLKADGTALGPYLRTWTVSDKDRPAFGLKTVTVTVAWRDSAARTTSLSAYVRCSTVPCP